MRRGLRLLPETSGVQVVVTAWAVVMAACHRIEPSPRRVIPAHGQAGADVTATLETTDGASPSPPPPIASAAALTTDHPVASNAHFDVNHVLATGQSLAVGFKGTPALSTTQPYANRSFASGVIADAYGLSSFVPLVEGDVVSGHANTLMYVETMSSGFANLVAKLAREGTPMSAHDLLVSVHGVSGSEYAGLRKGTKAYALGMKQVAAARAVTERQGQSYAVRAVTVVHGEADHTSGNTRYEANLIAWQADYEADVAALTGHARPLPLFQTQMSAWTVLGSATSAIPAAQLAAHAHAPGKVILVGPKYHLPYSDGLHLTNEGYRHMGEEYAKAYRRVVLEEKAWEPLRPRSLERVGDTIMVTFHVPSPPLFIDTKLVSDPGNFGFSYVDDALRDASAIAVSEVTLAGSETVRVRLSGVPIANVKGRLRYAWSGTPGAAAGPRTGARGNLRDSDSTNSRFGYSLYNWCVHFEEPIP